MAKTCYLSTTGDNLNDGLTPSTPKKDVTGVRAITAAGDLVLIAPGIYPEPKQLFNSATDDLVLWRKDPTKPGKVIIDFENSGDYYPGNEDGYGGPASHWRGSSTYAPRFLDLHFRNPNASAALVAFAYSTAFMHCVFYQRDGAANSGNGLVRVRIADYVHILNCTFYNLATGIYQVYGTCFGNYLVSVTSPIFQHYQWHDYNAHAGNTEANGINTSTGANPGLTDAPNEDFTLDSVTTPADWATFMSSGFQGGSIGAWGNGGILYDPRYPQLKFISQAPTVAQGNPQPVWENEGPNGTNTYTDGTPTDVIENPSTGEPELDLLTVPTATGGRIRSDVMNLGAATALLRAFSFSGFQDLPNGAAFDFNTTLPIQQEYRSSATPFLKGDVSPTWTAYARGDNINQTHRYFQVRMTLRTDHTNA